MESKLVKIKIKLLSPSLLTRLKIDSSIDLRKPNLSNCVQGIPSKTLVMESKLVKIKIKLLSPSLLTRLKIDSIGNFYIPLSTLRKFFFRISRFQVICIFVIGV